MAGAVRAIYDYDGFGIQINPDTNSETYRFVGEQYDAETNLYSLRARYYQPKLGRFLTADISQGSAGDPLSLHRYTYASENPITNRDPSGQYTLTEAMATVTIPLFTRICSEPRIHAG
jgi:RHS repeat-associated protein